MNVLCWVFFLWAAVGTDMECEVLRFGGETLPGFVAGNDAVLERVPHEGGYAHRVRFAASDWPNVFFRGPEGGWDWRGYAGVAVSLYNPGDRLVQAAIRVDNAGADGVHHCNTVLGGVPAKGRQVLRLRFNTGAGQRLWGMRGVPGGEALGSGTVIDAGRIVAFQVFLPRPRTAADLIFERAWVYREQDSEISMPFVDMFGQYKHADWPGKIHSGVELETRARAESTMLEAYPTLAGRDTYGGWADGPQLEATGWFRTQEHEGKWWLVTPGGRLFFSLGMDCVGAGEQTFTAAREDWFEWLPSTDDPAYGRFHAEVSGAHSGAEHIGGQGRTFNFYRANLYRKHGAAWMEIWRQTAYRRIQAWGFNTLGNWSSREVLEGSPIPYTVSTGIGGVPVIAGADGYWAKMMDVYDPVFVSCVDAAVAGVTAPHARNPFCIGYFVDNELAWEGVAEGTLRSPAHQPCRNALVAQLIAKYGGLEQVNSAWGTGADTWDALRAPVPLTGAAAVDMEEYLHAFARRYFESIQAAFRRHAPHQLYLGCRFAAAPEPVMRAAAEKVDVMSFNLYVEQIPPDQWTGAVWNKPLLIGEFHFGALDRGMFHAGLVASTNQQERAADYVRYVRSVVDHPAFVGCHWFQFVDEPVTGRWYDGENYNIGFVDVTDTPYPEITEAARTVHAEIYLRRAGRLPGP